jgi:hypothetical protein
MIALAAEPDFLTYLASWLESHARRGSMSSDNLNALSFIKASDFQYCLQVYVP